MKIFLLLCFVFITHILFGQANDKVNYIDSRGVRIEFSEISKYPKELHPIIKSKAITSTQLDPNSKTKYEDENYLILAIKKQSKNTYSLKIRWQGNYYICVKHYLLLTSINQNKEVLLKEIRYLKMEI